MMRKLVSAGLLAGFLALGLGGCDLCCGGSADGASTGGAAMDGVGTDAVGMDRAGTDCGEDKCAECLDGCEGEGGAAAVATDAGPATCPMSKVEAEACPGSGSDCGMGMAPEDCAKKMDCCPGCEEPCEEQTEQAPAEQPHE